jgi:hypothetical protein
VVTPILHLGCPADGQVQQRSAPGQVHW